MNITSIKQAEELAQVALKEDNRLNLGNAESNKVVTKDWEKNGNKRTYINVYCYTLSGNYKGKYDLGYFDNNTNEYVATDYTDVDLSNDADIAYYKHSYIKEAK